MAKTAVKKKPVAPKPKLVASKKPVEQEDKPAASEAVIGGNSGIDKVALRKLVDRIVNLEEEKRGLGEDIKEVYTEAKLKGMAPKVIRKIVAIEMADKEKLRQEKELLELYLFALDPELADVLS